MARRPKTFHVPGDAAQALARGERPSRPRVTTVRVVVHRDQVTPREDASRLFSPEEFPARWWPGSAFDEV